MAVIKFTLNALSGATSRSLRFEPRNAPWVNDAGKIVTPDGFTKTYVRNIENTENLDVGPWRVRIGSGVDDWYSFNVTAVGGNLKDLIAFGIPDDTPASSLAAAVEAFGAQWLSTFTDTTLAAKVTAAGPMKAALDNSYANVSTTVSAVDESGSPIPAKRARVVFGADGFPVDIILEDA